MPELRWTEEQRELADVLEDLLRRHVDLAAARDSTASRGYDEKLWSLLSEQVGVAGLAVPEEHGGAGFGFVEVAVALEEVGRSLAPTPLLGTTLATQALLASGDDAACSRLLPDIAAGTTTATLAWSGVTGMPDAPVDVTAADGVLTGSVDHVLSGDTTDLLLVVAEDDEGPAFFEVDSGSEGVTRTRTPAMDPALTLARIDLDGCEATRLGGRTDLGRLHAVGAASVAATATGVARRGLEMTVAYSKEREQFGRPIGSFQALKHRMADLLVLVETARSISLSAALAVAEDDEPARRTSVAKAWCDDALEKVAAETVQLHGGIAITWEHDAHLVLKRAHALRQLFGPAQAHRRTLL